MEPGRISPAILKAATDALSGSTEWTLYLQLLQGSNSIERIIEDDPRWPGAFTAVKRLQEQTTTVGGVSDATRMLGGSTLNLLTAEDETAVNAAAVILLQSHIFLALNSNGYSIEPTLCAPSKQRSSMHTRTELYGQRRTSGSSRYSKLRNEHARQTMN
jgi:hypothetical protein